MASRSHPLLVPEIVAIIFDHLQNVDGTSRLVACAQVSRLWADEAIRRMWYEDNCSGYEVDRLLTLPIWLRQSYANRMRSIDDISFIDLEHKHNVLLAPLKFPRLESASFLIPRNCNERFHLQYLGPSLRSLQLYEHGWNLHGYDDCAGTEYVSDDFLLQIQQRCPNLEEFAIEGPEINAHADSIHKFLRNTPSVRRLSIISNRYCYHPDSDEGLSKDAYKYLFVLLAKYGKLRELKWDMFVYPALVEEVIKATPRPFRQLRYLNCNATDMAMVRLLPHLLDLEILDLKVDTAPSRLSGTVGLGILPSLAKCTNLRVFKLSASSENEMHIPLQGFLDFAHACNQLEQLELDGRHFATITVPGITDYHFETLVSQLPRLRILDLDLNTDFDSEASFTTRSLFSVGAHCPGLEELFLGGVFDLSLLGSTDRVLFPNLRKTMLGHIHSTSESSSADSCAMMMYYHAPKSIFSVRHKDLFGKAVDDAYWDLRQKPHGFVLEQALEYIGKLKDGAE